MEISREKMLWYYEEAKKYKDDIKSDYNEIYDLTDTSFSIKDDSSRGKTTTRKVDSSILEGQSFMTNYIMSSVFSKTESWAKLKSNIDVLKILTETDSEQAKMIAEEIDKILEKNSETVYHTNDTTNYYTETTKALADCIKVGTGIRKIIELNSNARPFTYAYQNLDNIYFLEDTQGKPNIIFKRYVEKNLSDLNDMFGHLGMKTPDGMQEEELSEKISVVESVIGEFDEAKSVTRYHHFLHTDGFEEELLYEVLEYNPYTIFRWEVDSSNPWGIGIGRKNKGLFQELYENIAKRQQHRDKIVDPPINFYGDITLMNKVSLKAGARNWGGNWNDGNHLGVQPINLGTNLIPIDQDIADCRERIKAAYMAQPLGDVGDTTNRSATEMQLRHEMFRKTFSTTYELLNTELLEPTFMNAYYILEKKGLLEDTGNEQYVTHSQIHYVNELTQNAGRDKAMKLVDAYGIATQILSEQERTMMFKGGKVVEYIRDKMRIPMELVNNEQEIAAMIEQQQRMQEITLLAQAQENVGKRAETGIAPRIKEGVEALDDF